MPKHDMALKGAWPVTPMQTDDRVTPLKRKGVKMRKIPMRLQFFAEDANAGTTGNANTTPAGQQTAVTQPQLAVAQTQAVDYSKIQQMLDGTLAAKEDTALKAYFKQQGLSQEEAEQAMASFKQQRAAQHPDAGALQQQLVQVQEAAQRAAIENKAILAAVELGIDAKTVPYLLKMADLSAAMGTDGKINEETLKSALNTVLEAVPALKPAPAQAAGFVQVGAAGGSQQAATDDALKAAFGIK